MPPDAEELLVRNGGDIVSRLSLDHQRLAESVTALEGLLERLNDPDAVQAFVSHLEFVHEFCELLHFPMEDAFLEVVLEAGLTPSERRVVFVNLAQHQQIYADAVAVLERAAGQHVAGQEPAGIEGHDDIRVRAEAYVKALRGHLEFETRHLQPLLRRHLPDPENSRLQSVLRDLLGTLAGKPLERLAALDAASRAIAAV
jgi:hemerythrin-like domain-containing protein